MNNKINILWIEDNPCGENVEIEQDLIIPKFLKTEHFNYMILQHPIEIRNYLDALNEISLKKRDNDILSLSPKSIPDIIVFDYKLSDGIDLKNFSGSLVYGSGPYSHQKFIEEHNPTLELVKKFELETELFFQRNNVINYTTQDFVHEVGIQERNIANDNFGLYSGVILLKHFKNIPVVGVPASINREQTQNFHSRYFEWLISYDLEDSIKRPENPEEKPKDWESIHKFSLPLFRDQIINKVKTNKIVVDIPHLIKLIDEIISKSDKTNFNKLHIRYNTEFGSKNILLESIFSDDENSNEIIAQTKSDQEKLKKEIDNIENNKRLSSNLKKLIHQSLESRLEKASKIVEIKSEKAITILGFLKTLLESCKYDHATIENAELIADDLFSAYKNRFYARVRLSQLHSELITNGLANVSKEIVAEYEYLKFFHRSQSLDNLKRLIHFHGYSSLSEENKATYDRLVKIEKYNQEIKQKGKASKKLTDEYNELNDKSFDEEKLNKLLETINHEGEQLLSEENKNEQTYFKILNEKRTLTKEYNKYKFDHFQKLKSQIIEKGKENFPEILIEEYDQLVIDFGAGLEGFETITKSNLTHIGVYKKFLSIDSLRLAVLQLLAKCEIALNKNKIKDNSSSHIHIPLEEEEIYYILNPVNNTSNNMNMILPMHIDRVEKKMKVDDRKGWVEGKIISDSIINEFKTPLKRILELNVQQKDALNLASWMNEKEKQYLKAKFSLDLNFFPHWLI